MQIANFELLELRLSGGAMLKIACSVVVAAATEDLHGVLLMIGDICKKKKVQNFSFFFEKERF